MKKSVATQESKENHMIAKEMSGRCGGVVWRTLLAVVSAVLLAVASTVAAHAYDAVAPVRTGDPRLDAYLDRAAQMPLSHTDPTLVVAALRDLGHDRDAALVASLVQELRAMRAASDGALARGEGLVGVIAALERGNERLARLVPEELRVRVEEAMVRQLNSNGGM